jgi:hypothetical protein
MEGYCGEGQDCIRLVATEKKKKEEEEEEEEEKMMMMRKYVTKTTGVLT